MNVEQEQHLQDVKEEFYSLVDRKYRKGAKKHGGDLLSSSALILCNHALDEAIDQVVYLLTLRSELEALTDDEYTPITRAAHNK